MTMNTTTTDDGMTAGQYVLTALLALGVMTVMVGAVLYGTGVIDGSTLPAIQDGSDRPDTLPGTDEENETGDLNNSDDSSNPAANDSDSLGNGTDGDSGDSSSSDPTGDEPDENNSSDQEYPIDVGDGDGNSSGDDANETALPTRNSSNWTDAERERAAEMIAQYYEGYLTGISMATDSGWAHEQGQIENGEREPWPLEEWNSTDDAFEDGMEIGSRNGSAPLERDYDDRNPTTPNSSDDS